MLLKMAAFAVGFWSTLDAYFIRIEIKLEAEISVSLLALHVLYTGEKKSVCISGTTFSFKNCEIHKIKVLQKFHVIRYIAN